MDLAKPCLDVGVFTNQLDDMRTFYEDTIGLRYDHLLKLGEGGQQHRFDVRGSVFKLNHHRDPLTAAPTSFSRLVIADPSVAERRVLRDPDGTEVELVPPGEDGVTDIAIHWLTPDAAVLGDLLAQGFGAEPDGTDRWRIGTTLLVLEAGDVTVGAMRALGFRYLTVQVRDVVAEHRRLLECGWTEGTAPVRLGDVAYISFVRDPQGAWIEVSQRASLTGPLPD